MTSREPTNPFRFGALALDESFADREREREELVSDIRNGQDVVIFAPRRCGKSSLIWSTAQVLAREGILVAQVDLMTTPTKERLAASLARTIFETIASPLERIKERALAPFRSLQIQPTVTVDPEDGSLSFSFATERSEADIDATLERLLQLPAELGGAGRRRTALVMDEFQEIVEIGPGLPKMLRSVFQRQPDVAHVYLGSKRHVMEQIFSDANEPFWRSAKPAELGPIAAEPFARFLVERFRGTDREVDDGVIEDLLAITGGHPYATQELAYSLWEQVPPGGRGSGSHLGEALAAVLRSEHAHFTLLWEGASTAQRLVLEALAREPGHPFSAPYRTRHSLPAATNVQKALGALRRREVVAGSKGAYRIAEPFLAVWLQRQVLDSVAGRGVAPSSGSASEKPKRSWRRRSGRGAHQFHSPNRRISEGTSRARTIVASSSTPTAIADRDLLHEEDGADAEGEEDDGDRQRGRGDHAAGAADPDRHRLLVAVAEVVLLLDPRHHQHRVVGGEAEDDGEEEDQAGHLDRGRAGVVEEAVEPALLEGEDDDARASRRASARSSAAS